MNGERELTDGTALGGDTLAEVKEFLSSLRGEFPELYKPAAMSPAPVAGDPAGLIAGRVLHWAGVMGVSYGRVRVKDQRSLWGSCTRDGNLNFNWRLTAAPPEILDYVVIHELAHRWEMNHSRRFWEKVAAFCPEHRARRRWLVEHAEDLRRARREPRA